MPDKDLNCTLCKSNEFDDDFHYIAKCPIENIDVDFESFLNGWDWQRSGNYLIRSVERLMGISK